MTGWILCAIKLSRPSVKNVKEAMEHNYAQRHVCRKTKKKNAKEEMGGGGYSDCFLFFCGPNE